MKTALLFLAFQVVAILMILWVVASIAGHALNAPTV